MSKSEVCHCNLPCKVIDTSQGRTLYKCGEDVCYKTQKRGCNFLLNDEEIKSLLRRGIVSESVRLKIFPSALNTTSKLESASHRVNQETLEEFSFAATSKHQTKAAGSSSGSTMIDTQLVIPRKLWRERKTPPLSTKQLQKSKGRSLQRLERRSSRKVLHILTVSEPSSPSCYAGESASAVFYSSRHILWTILDSWYSTVFTTQFATP